jgi:hypothetical protein
MSMLVTTAGSPPRASTLKIVPAPCVDTMFGFQWSRADVVRCCHYLPSNQRVHVTTGLRTARHHQRLDLVGLGKNGQLKNIELKVTGSLAYHVGNDLPQIKAQLGAVRTRHGYNAAPSAASCSHRSKIDSAPRSCYASDSSSTQIRTEAFHSPGRERPDVARSAGRRPSTTTPRQRSTMTSASGAEGCRLSARRCIAARSRAASIVAKIFSSTAGSAGLTGAARRAPRFRRRNAQST